MSAATVTADAEAAPLATPKTKSGTQYTLLIDALSLARTSLAEQSRLLGDTQDRVQQLVSAQQRLQELAAVEVKKRRAVAGVEAAAACCAMATSAARCLERLLSSTSS